MAAPEISPELEPRLELERRYSDVVPAPSSRLPRAHRLTALRPSSTPPRLTVFGKGVRQNAY